jgi:hypothetical protein
MTQTSIPTALPDFINDLTSEPLTAAVNFYAHRLPLNEKAVAFIAAELKLNCGEAAKRSIGFSDRRLGKTLPSKESQQGGDLREQLKSVMKSNGSGFFY